MECAVCVVFLLLCVHGESLWCGRGSICLMRQSKEYYHRYLLHRSEKHALIAKRKKLMKIRRMRKEHEKNTNTTETTIDKSCILSSFIRFFRLYSIETQYDKCWQKWYNAVENIPNQWIQATIIILLLFVLVFLLLAVLRINTNGIICL